MTARQVRLERLLGRPVLAGNNKSIGRLEEVRAEGHGNGLIVTGYVIGPAGMMERLDVAVRMLFARVGGGYLARWDQLDISDEEHPRLTCAVTELEKL